jgi:hypothetical protein
MPLVQGPVTVAKVEALLRTATGLSKEEVLGIVGRAATPLVKGDNEQGGEKQQQEQVKGRTVAGKSKGKKKKRR